MTVSQTMADALAELETAFEETSHPWAAHTSPGPTVDQIRHEIGPTGLTLPDELIELWSWRSGNAPDDHRNGWMLPGEFQVPKLADSIRLRSEMIDDEMLHDDWYMKTDWLVALEAGPVKFWAHTAADKSASVTVTPVDLWDPAGGEITAPDCTVALTTVISDMARMLREKHWTLCDVTAKNHIETVWMRNPEVGNVSDRELGYTWASF